MSRTTGSNRRGWRSAVADRLSAAVRTFGSTLVTEAVVVLGTLFIFWYVARLLGPTGFAEYQLARATLTSSEPLLLLGLGVGLPRFVARTIAARGGVGGGFLRVGMWTGLGVLCVVVPAGLIFRQPLAALLFGDPALAPLLVALLVPVVGLVVCGIAYSYLRGRQMGTAANALRVAGFFVSPLFAALVSDSVVGLLVVYGGVMTIISIGVLIWQWPPPKTDDERGNARTLLLYSVPRVPGDMASAALLTLPVILATHLVGLIEAGFVGFGTSVIALVVAAMGPLSFVLVPKLSAAIGSGRAESAYRSARTLPLICGVVAAAQVVVLWFLMDLVVNVYLGDEFGGAAQAARLVMVSAVPLAVFLGARSTVDVFYETARNARNLVICVVVEVTVTFVAARLVPGVTAIATGLFVACAVLAVLTVVAQMRVVHARAAAEPHNPT